MKSRNVSDELLAANIKAAYAKYPAPALDPASLEEQVRTAQQNKRSAPPTRRIRIALVAAALTVCLAMAVSAVAMIMSRVYLPGKGFVFADGVSIKGIEEIQPFGEKTIEGVMLIDDHGSRSLSVVLSSEAASPDMPTEIAATDGEGNTYTLYAVENDAFASSSSSLRHNKPAKYHTMKRYEALDVPDVTNLTLSAGNDVTEIGLNVYPKQYFADKKINELSVTFWQMSKGSLVLLYDIQDETDIHGSFSEYAKYIHYSPHCMFTDINGTEYFANTGVSMQGEFSLQNMLKLDERPNTLKEITISSIFCSYTLSNPEFDANPLYAEVEIPIPEDGQTLYFGDGLQILDQNGFRVSVDAISRAGNEITVFAGKLHEMESGGFRADPYVVYNGPGEGIDAAFLDFTIGSSCQLSSQGEYNMKASATIEEGQTSYRPFISGFSVTINGEWVLKPAA